MTKQGADMSEITGTGRINRGMAEMTTGDVTEDAGDAGHSHIADSA